MANRSYLYSLDVFPDYLTSHAVGLSESEYNIPLIYRILVSSYPQATKSILFAGNERIAITADYDGGVRKLEGFFSKLPQEYKSKADNILAFLKDPKNRQEYIHLECEEIYEMGEGESAEQNKALLAELADIDEEIKKALKRIHYDGDTFELRELEDDYWSNILYYMPGSADEDDDDEESEDDDETDVESDVPEKETASSEPSQTAPESNAAKVEDIESYLAEPEYHQYGYGGGFFALIIKEGEEVALPLEPEKMFEDGDYRLFVLDKDGEKIGEIEYHRAIELIRKFGYFETLDKVDGFDCLFFQNPPKKDFLQKILAEATKSEPKAPSEENAPNSESSPKITRTLVNGENPAYFETVHVEGDDKNPAGIEMLRTVLTRAQSDAAMDYVFSESTQIRTEEDVDDEEIPIDSFNFFWAIKYCNALSITCGLEPCYSIDGELTPQKWLDTPYYEYNSGTKQWESDSKNMDYYSRIEFNPNANGWRLPTLAECWRAAKTDGIEKTTIDEIKSLWIWSDAIPKHCAIVPSDWTNENLTEMFNSPEVVLPEYSLRICRNAGTVLPSVVDYDWRKARAEAEEYENRASDSVQPSDSYGFDKEAAERRAEEFWQACKAQREQASGEQESEGGAWKMAIPIVLLIAGFMLFTVAGGVSAIYFLCLGFFFYMFKKRSRDRKNKEFSKNQETVMSDFDRTVKSFARKDSGDSGEYETMQAGQFTVRMPKQNQQDEQNEQEDAPDYAGWWNYKPDGMNDFQQSRTEARTGARTESQPVVGSAQAGSQDDDANERGMYTHEQAQEILHGLHKIFQKESIRIKTSVRDAPIHVTASKFGGLPYWPQGEEFPKDENGKPLFLLAQINFADVPYMTDYPDNGLLQIFVQGYDTWGLDFKENNQKNWRIVWRDVISPELALGESELRALGVKTAADEDEESGDEPLPFKKEYALSFEKQVSFMQPICDDFSESVQIVAKELELPVFDGDALDWFDEDDYNAFDIDDDDAKHQIGGYPFFTQSDVRREDDILLFQMDSELGHKKDGKGDGWEILWGDCGIANFFLSLDDLKRRDFSNVLYNWDCY